MEIVEILFWYPSTLLFTHISLSYKAISAFMATLFQPLWAPHIWLCDKASSKFVSSTHQARSPLLTRLCNLFQFAFVTSTEHERWPSWINLYDLLPSSVFPSTMYFHPMLSRCLRLILGLTMLDLAHGLRYSSHVEESWSWNDQNCTEGDSRWNVNCI